MVPEAKLVERDGATVPEGDGWYVLNARDATWHDSGPLGTYCHFEGDVRFAEVGCNISILQPGQPACMYHAEGAQEGFLVLEGACLLLVEGQERPLRRWDFVHCPAETRHVIVGAGTGPSVLLAFGARKKGKSLLYPVDPVALKHGAGVQAETALPAEAYAQFPDSVAGSWRGGDVLPA